MKLFKNSLFWFVIVFTVLVLAACGSNNGNTQTTPISPAQGKDYIKGIVTQFFSDIKSGDFGAAQKLATQKFQFQCSGNQTFKDCVFEVLSALNPQHSPYQDACGCGYGKYYTMIGFGVANVDVESDYAQVKVGVGFTDAATGYFNITLLPQDGTWEIDDFTSA